jgi:multiple sugar transport system substrate-binding protein
MKRKLGILGLAVALPLALTACVGGSDTESSSSGATVDQGSGTGEIQYWLWDANQLPMYQACADAFHTANPDVTVKISQFGWDDYWTKVTTGFVSGTAPDVFTDHLSKYPEFVTNGQLAVLDDLVAKDGVPTDIYQPGLAELWVGNDGKRYGMPKDWDTVGLFYNQAMADAAGLTKEQLAALEWNPTDGGTYEETIAKLTVDANGVHGDQPGFDKGNVKTYGLGLSESGGSNGQTQWSMYTGSNGWEFTNKDVWGDHYNYDDPKFQETIAWWKSLIDKGYMPPLEKTVGASVIDQFGAGNYASITEGDWNTNAITSTQGVTVGIAPTPVGPSGARASMFNGLADSIWSGSKNQAAAWKWVKYLASPECQDTVGKAGVVFPAIPSGTEAAKAAFAAKGIDVSAFTTQVDDKTTFLFPITDHAAAIQQIMKPAMDNVLNGSADVSSLTEANDQVNALFPQ